MSPVNKSGTRHKPTFSRAIKEEVFQYFQDHDGEVKHTAIYIHFALEHHEEISDILEEFLAEGFIQYKDEGRMMWTKKGKKAFQRLRALIA